MKRTLSISAFCLLFSALAFGQFNFSDLAFQPKPQANSSPNVTSGLVAWYKLDDGTGTSAADSSDNGYTSYLAGSVLPTWISGQVGSYALLFDGTNSVLNASNSVRNALSKTNSFTITMWLSCSMTNGEELQYALNSSLASADRFCILIQPNAGTYKLYTGQYTGSDKWLSIPFNYTNTYVHVSVVASNNGTTTLYCYTNGVLATGSTSAESAVHSGKAQFGFANNSGQLRGLTGGKLDDIRVYNRVLSSSEILTVKNWTP